MKTVKVILDGKEHEIAEMRSRENAAWRELLQEDATDIMTVIAGAPQTDLTDGQALAALGARITELALGSVDTIGALCREYAPTLPWDDAYDSEVIAAFWVILGLAFPFGWESAGTWAKRLNELGSAAPPMKRN